MEPVYSSHPWAKKNPVAVVERWVDALKSNVLSFPTWGLAATRIEVSASHTGQVRLIVTEEYQVASSLSQPATLEPFCR